MYPKSMNNGFHTLKNISKCLSLYLEQLSSEENLQICLSIFIFNDISVPKIHKYDTIQYMNIKIKIETLITNEIYKVIIPNEEL